jgi:hypothetical protein
MEKTAFAEERKVQDRTLALLASCGADGLLQSFKNRMIPNTPPPPPQGETPATTYPIWPSVRGSRLQTLARSRVSTRSR